MKEVAAMRVVKSGGSWCIAETGPTEHPEGAGGGCEVQKKRRDIEHDS